MPIFNPEQAINPDHILAAPMAAAQRALGWRIYRDDRGQIYVNMRPDDDDDIHDDAARNARYNAVATAMLAQLFLTLIQTEKEILV